VIECVPNVSEGRDDSVIGALAETIRATPGVFLLNVHSDPDHNRSVYTYVSESPQALRDATLALVQLALNEIDLTRHKGAHPRSGAVDVIPFVPLHGSSMAECVELAGEVAWEIAGRFGVPIYLYEESARSDFRRDLPVIRSGGFEGFPEKIKDPRWLPDYGPSAVHPTAGVAIVGARVPLIAFNVQLATDRLEVAQKVARAVRGISGGLRYVRALPIELKTRGIVQVSMNLLDYRRTPMQRAFDLVESEARHQGVEVLSSEIVGLVPADALYQVAEWHLRIAGFRRDIVLEERIALMTVREEG
jgi:glutamate formiminotransferase